MGLVFFRKGELLRRTVPVWKPQNPMPPPNSTSDQKTLLWSLALPSFLCLRLILEADREPLPTPPFKSKQHDTRYPCLRRMTSRLTLIASPTRSTREAHTIPPPAPYHLPTGSHTNSGGPGTLPKFSGHCLGTRSHPSWRKGGRWGVKGLLSKGV